MRGVFFVRFLSEFIEGLFYVVVSKNFLVCMGRFCPLNLMVYERTFLAKESEHNSKNKQVRCPQSGVPPGRVQYSGTAQ